MLPEPKEVDVVLKTDFVLKNRTTPVSRKRIGETWPEIKISRGKLVCFRNSYLFDGEKCWILRDESVYIIASEDARKVYAMLTGIPIEPPEPVLSRSEILSKELEYL